MSEPHQRDRSVFTQPDPLPLQPWICQHCQAANPPAAPHCQTCTTNWLRICPECADLGRSILKRGTTTIHLSARHIPIVPADTGRCGLCGYAIDVAAQRADLRQQIADAERHVSTLAEQQRQLESRPRGWKGMVADGKTALLFAMAGVLVTLTVFNDIYVFWFQYDPLRQRISATAGFLVITTILCTLGAVIGFGLTRIKVARQQLQLPRQLAAARSTLQSLKDMLQSTTS